MLLRLITLLAAVTLSFSLHKGGGTSISMGGASADIQRSLEATETGDTDKLRFANNARQMDEVRQELERSMSDNKDEDHSNPPVDTDETVPGNDVGEVSPSSDQANMLRKLLKHLEELKNHSRHAQVLIDSSEKELFHLQQLSASLHSRVEVEAERVGEKRNVTQQELEDVRRQLQDTGVVLQSSRMILQSRANASHDENAYVIKLDESLKELAGVMYLLKRWRKKVKLLQAVLHKEQILFKEARRAYDQRKMERSSQKQTSSPTSSPTQQPTKSSNTSSPSSLLLPTIAPTLSPSRCPSLSPSPPATLSPSSLPTTSLPVVTTTTRSPSSSPTSSPSSSPTSSPSLSPMTLSPSSSPFSSPVTLSPSTAAAPNRGTTTAATATTRESETSISSNPCSSDADVDPCDDISSPDDPMAGRKGRPAKSIEQDEKNASLDVEQLHSILKKSRRIFSIMQQMEVTILNKIKHLAEYFERKRHKNMKEFVALLLELKNGRKAVKTLREQVHSLSDDLIETKTKLSQEHSTSKALSVEIDREIEVARESFDRQIVAFEKFQSAVGKTRSAHEHMSGSVEKQHTVREILDESKALLTRPVDCIGASCKRTKQVAT
eukprot:jgi/Bigna1/138005/aug1.42_g12713